MIYMIVSFALAIILGGAWYSIRREARLGAELEAEKGKTYATNKAKRNRTRLRRHPDVRDELRDRFTR